MLSLLETVAKMCDFDLMDKTILYQNQTPPIIDVALLILLKNYHRNSIGLNSIYCLQYYNN